jgi:hypothetical protein
MYTNKKISIRRLIYCELSAKVRSYTRLLHALITSCTANNTSLELFEILQNNAEIMKKWNEEINLFIQQEEKPSVLEVTY